MSSKRNVDMSATEDTIKIVASADDTAQQAQTDDAAQEAVVVKAAPAPKKGRSKKYTKARSKLDKTKKYSVEEAVAVVKKLSYSKFPGTLTLDAVVKEAGKISSVTLPHSTGKTIRVAIVDDALLVDIEAGKIEFDALLTTPQYMPKLAKFARILGPKGLMPNPKNGTVTPKPEVKKAQLEKGTFELKTEKKAPVVHVTVGKTSMEDAQLTENIQTLIDAMKGKVISASLSATMSPGVKIEVVK